MANVRKCRLGLYFIGISSGNDSRLKCESNFPNFLAQVFHEPFRWHRNQQQHCCDSVRTKHLFIPYRMSAIKETSRCCVGRAWGYECYCDKRTLQSVAFRQFFSRSDYRRLRWFDDATNLSSWTRKWWWETKDNPQIFAFNMWWDCRCLFRYFFEGCLGSVEYPFTKSVIEVKSKLDWEKVIRTLSHYEAQTARWSCWGISLEVTLNYELERSLECVEGMSSGSMQSKQLWIEHISSSRETFVWHNVNKWATGW